MLNILKVEKMGRMYLKKCCVPNCYNVKYYNGNKIGEDKKTSNNYTFRLFKFPKDPNRCRKWLKLIGQPEMIIKTNTRVCSNHFTKEDYFKDKKIKMDDCSVGRRCLKGTAVPSKWLPERVPEDNMEVDEDIENDSEEPCLICGDKVKRGKRKRRRYKFDGGENLKLLNEQLWATFILREVLKVPRDKYGVLLGRIGGSVEPGKWFGICEDCETSVVKILGWRKTIRKIEGGIKEVEGILKKKLENSLEAEEACDWGINEILNVRREIRKCFKDNNCLSLKKDGMVEAEIKKEIFEVEYEQSDNHNLNEDKFNEDLLPQLSPNFDERIKENVDDNQSEAESSDNDEGDNDSEYKPEVEEDELKGKLKIRKQLIVNPGATVGYLKRKRISKAKPKPSCNLCSYKAWSPTKMERHIIEHKLFDNSVDPTISTVQFYCNICPISPSPSLFPTRPNLMRHKRINHPSQLNLTIYQCPVCPESFFYKASYSNHLFKKHPTHYHSTLSTTSKTSAPAITTNAAENSTNHDNLPLPPPPTQSPPPPETYFCDKCNYSTLFKHQFTRHLKHGHTSVPYICQYCSSTYKYSWSLDKHIKRYHPEQWTGPKRNVGVPDLKDNPLDAQQLQSKPINEKSVICNYCSDGARFPHKLALNLHLKETHKDLFKWQCNLCEKSYLRSTSLKTHLKINHLESGVKGKCEWCGKEVQHKTYLFGHWKICLKRPTHDAMVQEEENINQV